MAVPVLFEVLMVEVYRSGCALQCTGPDPEAARVAAWWAAGLALVPFAGVRLYQVRHPGCWRPGCSWPWCRSW